jgi:hypothetical protein
MATTHMRPDTLIIKDILKEGSTYEDYKSLITDQTAHIMGITVEGDEAVVWFANADAALAEAQKLVKKAKNKGQVMLWSRRHVTPGIFVVRMFIDSIVAIPYSTNGL